MDTILLIIMIIILSGCRDQSPEKTVSDFKDAQAAVQDAADRATPHVLAVVDKVIKPAIDQVNRDAQAMKNGKSVQAKKVEVTRWKRVESGWKVNTQFVYCYADSRDPSPTVFCYGEPMTDKQLSRR